MPDINQSLLVVLGKSAGLAYNYVRGAVSEKVRVTAALQAYRNLGGQIATQTFTDLFAAVAGRADVNQIIRLIGEDQPLPLTAHNLAVSEFSGGNSFQYLVGTNSGNPLIPEAIYVNSPNPLSSNEIFAKATAAFHYEEGSGLDPASLEDVVFTIDDARYMPQPVTPLPTTSSNPNRSS